MNPSVDVVQSAATAAGIIAEIESLPPGGAHVVPMRTPEFDAALLDALRTAAHPVTRANLLTIIRQLQVPRSLGRILPFLADADADVRGEAADTVGTLAGYAFTQSATDTPDTIVGALRARWNVETDDVVRGCLMYAFSSLAEPALLPLLRSGLDDPNEQVRELARAGLEVLDAVTRREPRDQGGTQLQGIAGMHQPSFVAETIHRLCCSADPYDSAPHPRRREIRRVLGHGARERSRDENVVIIRGRHFDLILPEDRPQRWTARVTDPAGLAPCRRAADHRYRVLLQSLAADGDRSVFAARRSAMYPDTPPRPDYVREYRTADDVLDGIAGKPDGAWFVIEPRTPTSDAAFVEALRRTNASGGPDTTELRGILCHILAELKPPAALEPVTDAVFDSDPGVQYEAVRALDHIIGYVPNPPPDTRRAQEALTTLWHSDIDDDLRSTVAGALWAFHDPDLRALLAEHRDSEDPRTRRLCRLGIERLDQEDPATRRIYTGPEFQGVASGYDDADLATLLHRDITDSDPYWERPHPREADIAKALRWGHRTRVAGQNVVRVTGRHVEVTIDEDEPARWSAAFLDPGDPGLPPCRLPWHRQVSTGFSSTAIGTDGHIASGPNNTGRAPQDG